MSVNPTIVTTRGDVTEATVMGLLPFTNYDCYVTANTSVGAGLASGTLTRRTVKNGECALDNNCCSCAMNICELTHFSEIVD